MGAAAGGQSAARWSRLLFFAEAAQLRKEHFLQLLEPLESRRQPSLEHSLGVHRLEVRAQPLLDFAEQLLLQWLHIRQAEKGPGLVRRAIDVEFELHRDRSCWRKWILDEATQRSTCSQAISCN